MCFPTCYLQSVIECSMQCLLNFPVAGFLSLDALNAVRRQPSECVAKVVGACS